MVPFLSDNEIERQAEHTREAALAKRIPATFPFNAELTIELLCNYSIDHRDELPDGAEGATSFDDRVVMFSSKITLESRRRFTAAHELGHVILHEAHYAGQHSQVMLFDASEASDKTPLVQDERAERQANAFASAILMPAKALAEHYGTAAQTGEWIDPQRVARDFGVSLEAAKIRLEKLGFHQRSQAASGLFDRI